jgi:GT2 family glycosyltransferase
MTRLSVVIPTCGRPAALANALASVYAQRAAPDEVIVVDDGAGTYAGATRSAVARFRRQGARVIANQRPKGPSGARNAGAERATGALLAFLDDDDEWLPEYLEEALGCFGPDGVDALCTDLLYRYDDGSERPGKRAPDALTASAFLTRNPGIIGSNLIIRSSLYRELGGFDESLPTYEDVDFGLRLSLHAGARYAPLHRPLVRHHQHTRDRLCMRLGDSMRAGVRRFFELHGKRMNAAEHERFRDSVRELWGTDEYGRVAVLPEAPPPRASVDV